MMGCPSPWREETPSGSCRGLRSGGLFGAGVDVLLFLVELLGLLDLVRYLLLLDLGRARLVRGRGRHVLVVVVDHVGRSAGPLVRGSVFLGLGPVGRVRVAHAPAPAGGLGRVSAALSSLGSAPGPVGPVGS